MERRTGGAGERRRGGGEEKRRRRRREGQVERRSGCQESREGQEYVEELRNRGAQE